MRGRAWRAAIVPLTLLAGLVLATSAHAQVSGAEHKRAHHAIVLTALSSAHAEVENHRAHADGVIAPVPRASAHFSLAGCSANASQKASDRTAATILVRGPPAKAV